MRGFATGFVALAVLVTATSSYFAFAPERSGTVAFWLLAGGPAVLFAAALAPWAGREGLLRSWLVPRWGDITRGIVGAGVLFGAALLFVRSFAQVGSPREIWLVSLYAQIGDPHVLQAHASVLAPTIAIIALAEEIVWRGGVAHFLAGRLGSRGAWVWSAVLYAAAYVPTSWSLRGPDSLNPVLVSAALVGGLLWGAMSRAFGSLVPSVIAHAIFDWLVIMVFPLWGARWRI
jgi:membrane protease YdiL (CAAX protease family)